jgi:hypothetical protein
MPSDAFTGSLRPRLGTHPICAAVSPLEALRVFVRHLVYAARCFMSLTTCRPTRVAPVRWPWTPRGDAAVEPRMQFPGDVLNALPSQHPEAP